MKNYHDLSPTEQRLLEAETLLTLANKYFHHPSVREATSNMCITGETAGKKISTFLTKNWEEPCDTFGD